MVSIVQTVNYIKNDQQLSLILSILKSLKLSGIRINLSKFDEKRLLKTVKIIEDVFFEEKKITLYLDIPYPKNKSRIQKVRNKTNVVEKNELYIVTTEKDVFDLTLKNAFLLNADFLSVEIGSIIFYADGEGMFEVVSSSKNKVVLKALNTFIIREGKAIMCGYRNESHEFIQKLVDTLEKIPCKKVYLLSFVTSRLELDNFKKFFKNSPKGEIVPKIETREAIQNIYEIAEESDALLLARGDLILNVPFSELDYSLERLKNTAKALNKDIIFCTDILKNMGTRIVPERSEIFDLLYMKASSCEKLILPANINFSYDEKDIIRNKTQAVAEIKNRITIINSILK